MEIDTSAFDEAQESSSPEIDTSAFDTAPTNANPEAMGKLESFGRGAAQGASFGFADEITGAVEAALTDKTYEQARDESRRAYKEAETVNPLTYFSGNLAGGIAIPGFGSGAAALRGGSKLASLGAAGAAAGGLTGAGSSEAEGGQLVKETAQGALLGGILTPFVGGVIPDSIKRTGEAIKRLPVMEDMVSVFNKAKSGNSLAGREKLSQLTNELKTDISERLFPFVSRDTQSIISEAYDLASKEAREKGKTVDLTDLISNAERTLAKKNIPSEEADKIINTLKRFAGAQEQTVGFKQINPMTRNPEEMEILKQMDNLKARQDVKETYSQMRRAGEPGNQLAAEVGTFEGTGPAFGTPMIAAKSQSAGPTISPLKMSGGKGEYSAIKPVTGEVYNTPQQTVDDLHNLKNVLEDFADTGTSAGREAIGLKKQVDDLIASISDENALSFASKLREIKSEAVSKLGLADLDMGMTDAARQSRLGLENQFLEKITNAMGTNRGMVAKQDISEGFSALKQLDPSKAAEIESDITSKAKDLYLSRQMNQPAVLTKDPMSFIAGGARGIAFQGADMAGKMSAGITNSTPGQLATMAAELASKGQNKYAEMLRKASLAEPSKRQALLFVLAQDPSFRQLVPIIGGE